MANRSSGGFARAGVIVGILLAVALGVWWFTRNGGAEEELPPPVEPAVGVADTVGAESPRAAGEPGREELLAAVESSPRIDHSVQVASYARRDYARGRLDEWREADGRRYFLAPARVGDHVHHRIFVSALGTRAEARALMEELVRSGRKEESHVWHVRSRPLAFRIGVFASEEEARESLGSLEDDGITGYVATAEGSGTTAFQVYAGAYTSEEEAEPLASALAETGRTPELVERRGTSVPR